MISYLKRNEIDDKRWDAVVAGSSAETLYAYSWYLDLVAPRWDALVMGDYSHIMPVVWSRKYGISYLYQPLYTQQLGVFSRHFADPTVISAMLKQLRGRFRLGDLQFNAANLVAESEGFSIQDRSNYVLPLIKSYEEIEAGYSQNAKRNIKKARGQKELVAKPVTALELLRLKRENDVIARSDADYRWQERLFTGLEARGCVELRGLFRNGDLLAGLCFAFSQKRAIYLLSASTEEGKQARAMFWLIDDFIQEHAATEMLLDFEGSNIHGIARFFSGFGAEPELYQHLHFSRLPRFFRKRGM